MVAFAIYLSSGQTLASYDSAPTSLLAFNVLERHRIDLDVFRRSYFTALGGQYAFAETPSGHLTSAYPVGAAIVSFPIYAVLYYADHGDGLLPAINTPAFEPFRQRYEKLAAAVVAAVSVGLFLLCAQEIGNPAQAGIATAVYALATSMWSTGSQALWQHGPLNLLILAMVYALFRASRTRAPAQSPWRHAAPWLVCAGGCAGLLPVIRPTAILFTVAALIFVSRVFGRRGLLFPIALGIGVAPGVAWNVYFFHSLLGGYGGIAHPYDLSPARALVPFAGMLISPSRGLFSFSPVLVFSVFGAVAATRVRAKTSRLLLFLAVAAAALVVQYAFFRYWWAGYAYGPRFLTDVAAVAALLLVYVIPARPLSSARRTIGTAVVTTVFLLTFCYSVAVQFAGTNSGAAGSEWNAVPISVDRQPERVWPIADNQIERNIRAAYFRFFAWNVAGSAEYDRGIATRVRALAPSFADVAPGALIDASAALDNTGRSRLYGYDTGVYIGQLRIRVRIVDDGQPQQVFPDQYLYVRGAPAAGERTAAVGTLTMPRKPGTYALECAPVLVGGSTDARGAPLRVRIRVR